MNFYISDHHFNNYNINKYCSRPYLHTNEGSNVIFNNKIIITCDTEKEAFYEAKKRTIELMHKEFIENWNRVVEPNNTVYYLGDFGFPMSSLEFKQILNLLNGKIILIKGNHDKSLTKMKEYGFHDAINYLEMTIGGVECILSHYPYINPIFNSIAYKRPNIIRKYKDSIPSNYDRINKAKSKIKDEFSPKDVSMFLTLALSGNLHIKNKKEKELYHFIKKMVSRFIGSRVTNKGKILIHGHTHSKVQVSFNMINVCVDAWNFTPVSEETIISKIKEIENTYKELLNSSSSEDIPDYYLANRKSADDPYSDLIQIKRILCHIEDKNNFAVDVPFNPIPRWFELAYKSKLFIPMSNLKNQVVYEGDCRNASIALWCSQNEKFYYIRSKFGSTFVEGIECPENEIGYDVFVAKNESKMSDEDKKRIIEFIKNN